MLNAISHKALTQTYTTIIQERALLKKKWLRLSQSMPAKYFVAAYYIEIILSSPKKNMLTEIMAHF